MTAADSYVRQLSVFDQAPGFLAFLSGPQFVFEFANEGYHRLIRRTKNVVGHPLREVLPEIDGQGYFELLRQVVATGVPVVRYASPLTLQPSPDVPAEESFVDFIYQPIRGVDGDVIGVLTSGVDVTEMKRAAAERERIERRYRTVFEVIDDGFCLLEMLDDGKTRNADYRFLEVNPAFERQTGLSNAAGRTARELVPGIGPSWFELYGEVADTGVSKRFENGEAAMGQRVFEVFASRVGAPELRQVALIFKDVSDIRKAEAEREALLRREIELREMIEVERDLANVVATMESSTRQGAEDARARSEFALAVSTALGESLELQVILQRLVEIIVPARGVIASVWDVADAKGMRRAVHTPFSASFVMNAADANAPMALPIKHVMQTQKTLVIPSYEEWMTARGEAASGATITALGIRSSLYCPVLRGADVVAVLTVGRGPDSPFVDEDVTVFETIARQVALAYDNARLFEETRRLREVAEAATVAKDRFLAHVSHDLRNPLNSILGWSTILRSAQNDSIKLLRGIDVIERNAKAQVQLIEDLLDISRITSGKLSLELAVEDARTSIETALDAAKLAAQAKEIELAVKIENDIGSIAVDPDRFRQIIWNLVSNAVKFTPAEGRVAIEATRVASKLQIVVSDNGRGIEPEFLPRVFETFEQAEAGANRKGGLGLGLAIVKHLVELHGGTIDAESAGVGSGARFTLRLPIRAAVPQASESNVAIDLGPLRGVRVLVVDDEEDARDVVAAILERAGADVLIAASVDEALKTLKRERPRAIVSDIGMPVKDGKDFLRAVRALPAKEGGRTPAVALTALVRAKDRIEILSAGFDAHLSKPIEPEELVLVIERLVEREIASS